MEEKQKILIVEDEVSIAELEKDYLELSGFLVDTEEDGEKGLKRALETDYNLLILDLMLPGRDGFSITQAVREKKDIPILLVSARKDDIDKIRGLGLGADDYLTKPFSASELVARVKAHLARYKRLRDSGKEENEIIEIRGLRIDTTARRLSLLPVSLTFWLFLRHIRIAYLQKKSFFRKFGKWNLSEILQPLPCILRRFARKLSSVTR